MSRPAGGKRRSAPARARFVRTLASILCLGLLAGCAGRARLMGKVVPPESSSKSRSQLEQTVLWIEAQAARSKRRPGTATIRMTEGGFEPSFLSVPVGTRLRFQNVGTVFHTPFSPSVEGGLRLEPVRPKEEAELVVSQAGELRLFCELHPDAAAVVFVLPACAYAVADSGGAFRLPSLPGGTYLLSYWHPEWGSGQRPIEVPPRGEAYFEVQF